jgi:hypothetical protein
MAQEFLCHCSIETNNAGGQIRISSTSHRTATLTVTIETAGSVSHAVDSPLRFETSVAIVMAKTQPHCSTQADGVVGLFFSATASSFDAHSSNRLRCEEPVRQQVFHADSFQERILSWHSGFSAFQDYGA